MAQDKEFKCPLCGGLIDVEGEFQYGETVYCIDCDEELKIVSINPLKLSRLIEYSEVGDGVNFDCSLGYDEDGNYREE